MIKYKINVADALERVKFNTYKAKTSGLISQETLKKFKKEDTNVSLNSLNNLCIILDMELKDIISFEMTEEEKEDIKDDYSTLKSDYADPAVRDNIRDKAAKLLAKIQEKRNLILFFLLPTKPIPW